jgi:putative ABC transport system permease protein
LLSYVWRDFIRNSRRTLVSLLGVVLGIGLFSGVLFFIDGSSATMTKRAIAPLALDMQRLLTSPLGRGLELREKASGPAHLGRGQRTSITLMVVNTASVPANEVVVADEPPLPLTYVQGSTTRDGRPLRDRAGQSPLAQGAARSGLNLGTLPPGETVKLSYTARAGQPVNDVAALMLAGKVSSREDVVPTPANSPPPLTLDRLETTIAGIPGVAAADRLASVDLPAGSLRTGRARVASPVRLFAFDRRYVQHYPSIRISTGSLKPNSAVLSAEASRALAAKAGGTVELTLPGRRGPLSLPVSGVADLVQAKPLFNSRKSSKFENFLYVPNSIVVTPETFERRVLPAFRAASARRGAILKSLPMQEVDVRLDRSRLHTNPASAHSQTKDVAQAIDRIEPSRSYLIDNISNTLAVASRDAAVGKRMFLFLGLPGLLLAAFLAAYAGSILAGAQRREHANLRVRGADHGWLLRMLACKTLALAGAGSVLGSTLGFLTAIAVLDRETLFEAGAGALALSAVLASGAGMLTTALALYIPARGSLGRDVSQERREVELGAAPGWRRLRLDVALLVVAAIAEAIAFAGGAFDAPPGSVSSGRAVSLPSRLLLPPVVAWVGGVLLAARILAALGRRLAVPRLGFGRVVPAIVGRSVRRRTWALATGVVGVGLVLAFGADISMFSASYDKAKAADARFVVGSDLRITPRVGGPGRSSSYASELRVPGVEAVTSLVFKAENSVLVGPYDQDHEDLAAIDPASFERAAPLSDSFFVGDSAAGAMRALRSDPRALLVGSEAAEQLSIERGDRVRVLLARGTPRQVLRTFHVAGLFDEFPGFPDGVNLVANLRRYEEATGFRGVDFFLASTTDHSHGSLAQATAALRTGPGKRDPIEVESAATALGKDQSSLTAINVQGLVDLDSLYTLLMSAACVGIFVFGLLLHRRREYVTLRAQGMRTGELRALLLSESGLVALCGLAAGALVGTGMAYLTVNVLRPLFILEPALSVRAGELAALAGLVLGATLVSALAASAVLGRLRPTELLRDP